MISGVGHDFAAEIFQQISVEQSFKHDIINVCHSQPSGKVQGADKSVDKANKKCKPE